MTAFYNEIDPFAAKWLRKLIDAKMLPPGKIRRGDIKKIAAVDIERYAHVHWFAGIGGWPYALRLAGWPDEVRCWTGSVPCQPFSSAGRRKGVDDERHLWPEFLRLIKEAKPPIIFGEQVASADVVGKVRPSAEEKTQRPWIEAVQADLEKANYEFGFVVLPACGVGAPHIRQRVFWVAIATGKRRERLRLRLRKWKARSNLLEARWRGETSVVADSAESRRSRRGPDEEDQGTEQPRRLRAARGMADIDGGARDEGRTESRRRDHRSATKERRRSRSDSFIGFVGDSRSERSGRNGGSISGSEARSEGEGEQLGDFADVSRVAGAVGRLAHANVTDTVDEKESRSGRLVQPSAHATAGFWQDVIWLPCQDGKWRPTEPTIFPLASGIPNRVGTLRGAGNSIAPQAAAAFIETVMEMLLDEGT
jgi:DNA (cytosine-5)-methyltransferase 1